MQSSLIKFNMLLEHRISKTIILSSIADYSRETLVYSDAKGLKKIDKIPEKEIHFP